MDRQFLASSKVGTPDPRQEHPFIGQRLIVAWDFPKSLFTRGLVLVTTVRFWDNTEEVLCVPMDRKRDVEAFFFLKSDETLDHRILTYRVQVFDREGILVEKWEHHFWTTLIDVGSSIEPDEMSSSAHEINCSVSSQPMQESVMETP